MTARFIRLKAFIPAQGDQAQQNLDYNVNLDSIVAFGEPMADSGLPADFKGTIINTRDGMRSLVHETPRKVRSLIAEANAGTASSEAE